MKRMKVDDVLLDLPHAQSQKKFHSPHPSQEIHDERRHPETGLFIQPGWETYSHRRWARRARRATVSTACRAHAEHATNLSTMRHNSWTLGLGVQAQTGKKSVATSPLLASINDAGTPHGSVRREQPNRMPATLPNPSAAICNPDGQSIAKQ
jgi:hypothetical protein